MSVPCQSDDGVHCVIWRADGEVNLCDHDTENREGELLLSGLFGVNVACFVVQDSLSVGSRERQIVAVDRSATDIYGMRAVKEDNVPAVILACARAWAYADPSLGSVMRNYLVDAKVFPADWQPWVDAGVDVAVACAFMREGIPLEATEGWIPLEGLPDRIALYNAARNSIDELLF